MFLSFLEVAISENLNEKFMKNGKIWRDTWELDVLPWASGRQLPGGKMACCKAAG